MPDTPLLAAKLSAEGAKSASRNAITQVCNLTNATDPVSGAITRQVVRIDGLFRRSGETIAVPDPA
jgi:hypothetical protein